MKNMKVSMKLIVSFLIVTALAVAIGVTGVLSLTTAAKNTDLLSQRTEIAIIAARMNRNIQAQRAAFRGAAVYQIMGMAANRENNMADLVALESDYEALREQVAAMLQTETGIRLMGEIDSAYTPFAKERDLFEDAIIDPNVSNEKMVAQLDAVAATVTPLATSVAALVDFADNLTTQMALDAATTASRTTIILIAVLTVAAVFAIMLALYISNLISKPLRVLTSFMQKAGTTGDITLSQEDVRIISSYAAIRDEIGVCIGATSGFVSHITEVAKVLELVADGDLTQDVTALSENDMMGVSLNKMTANLNNMFSEISNASNQVSTGSVQIADGAQLLAQGATEQSATVQELSASVTEVNGQTKANAGLATDAKKLGEDIKVNAERGNLQMEQMIKAVGEISDASTAIGNVIKIIDDIAFQTNILALNAAVEAARAGQHGKGFAVVADEVRSLAAKSAEAAKNTSELIATSIQKSEQGAAISKETAESLNQIVAGIIQSSELVARIAVSSNEQSISIGQIGDAIDQVSQVIQQNSATAEESAAASEEMSGQATMLQQLISQFKLKNQDFGGHAPALSERPRSLTPSTAMSLASGKY